MINQGDILVTGGAGFIGSALVWALNRLGIDDIIIADSLTTDEKWKNLRALRYADYMESDLLLQELGGERLKAVTTVFHLGAASSTTELDARFLVRNNFEYSRVLAEWAVKTNRRFVYASSAATYGDGANGMQDDIDCLQKLRPLNMYGYSKHLFDMHAQKKGWLNEIVGLKYFNIFGPNENHKQDMRSVVNKAYGQITKTGRASLFKSYHPDYGDGEQLRDFLYVKNTVDATIHLAGQSEASGIFNVGSGTASSWISLVTPIFSALSLPVQIDYVEMPEHLKGKYQYRTLANIDRLKATGWAGWKYNLSEAVKDYVQGYLVPEKYLGDEGADV